MEWLITHPAEETPEAPPPPPGSSAATQALACALAQAPPTLVSAHDAGAVEDEQVAAAMTAAPLGSPDSGDSAEVAERVVLAAAQADRVLQHAIPLLAKVVGFFRLSATHSLIRSSSLLCATRMHTGTWLCVCHS